MNYRRRGEFTMRGGEMEKSSKKSPSKEVQAALDEIKEIGQQKTLEEKKVEEIHEVTEDQIISEEPIEPTTVQEAIKSLKQLEDKAFLAGEHYEPIEEKDIVEENTSKTIKLSNARAGLIGSSRLRAKEIKKQPDQKTQKEISEEEWFEQGEKMSKTNTTLKQETSQSFKDKPSPKTSSSVWSRMKNKLGNTLRAVGLLSAVGGTAECLPEESGAAAQTIVSETYTQKQEDKNNWDKQNPLEKFTRSTSSLPSQLSKDDIEPRHLQLSLLEETLNEAGINPRKELSQKQKITLEENPQIRRIYQERNLLKTSLDNNTGWADAQKQKKFKELYQEPDIQKMLKNRPDLTIADAISLIKATVLNNDPSKEDPSITFRELLIERDRIAQTNFIDSKTERVVIFSYSAEDKEQFKGKELAELSKEILGKQKKDRVKLIEAGHLGNVTEETPGEQLLKEISDSPDNSVFYVATHSDKGNLLIGVSPDGKQQLLGLDGLASSFLIHLLNATQKQGVEDGSQSLGKMKIIIDGCSGYNLAQLIVDKMETIYNSGYKEILKKDFKELALPTIVTMAGDSSPVMLTEKSGIRALTSEGYKKLITDEGALTGKMLFKLQSESYVAGGDMSFFTSENGKLKEISSTTPTLKKANKFNYGNQILSTPSNKDRFA